MSTAALAGAIRDSRRRLHAGNPSQESRASSNEDAGLSHENAAIALASMNHANVTAVPVSVNPHLQGLGGRSARGDQDDPVSVTGQQSATAEDTRPASDPTEGPQPPPSVPSSESGGAASGRAPSPSAIARAALAAAAGASQFQPSDAAETGSLSAVQPGLSPHSMWFRTASWLEDPPSMFIGGAVAGF